MIDIVCPECGKTFSQIRKNTKFCCRTCKCSFYRKQYAVKRQFINIPPGSVGAIQELRVCADLLAKEFEVFRAVSPSCSCDVLALKKGKYYDIEVRTAYDTKHGRHRVSRRFMRANILAMAFPDRIKYDPELTTI